MKHFSKKYPKNSMFRFLMLSMLIIFAGGLLTYGAVAHAAPLGLNLLPFPDIASTSIDVEYDAVSDSFTAYGAAVTLNVGGGPQNITGGVFDLDAVIDGNGDLAAGTNTITISGIVSTLGYSSGTLLTGTLTDFGFIDPPGGDIFEFLFSVTGGDLAASFGSLGGVILDANFLSSAFYGTFTADFHNLGQGGTGYGAGTSDTAPVPEPATLALVLLGGGGLLTLHRRKKA